MTPSKPPSAQPINSSTGKGKPVDARAEILQQAKLLFRQKGFSAVSMNDLVSAVGLTKPTIYYHFTDKETLFTEVVVEMMRHGNELLVGGIKRCKTFREKLYRLSEGYFRFSPTSLSTMVRDASEHLDEAHMKQVMEAHRFYLISPIIGIFEEARQNGQIHPTENADALALYFISWVDAMTTLKMAHEGRDFDTKECAGKMVDIFLDGIVVADNRQSVSDSTS